MNFGVESAIRLDSIQNLGRALWLNSIIIFIIMESISGPNIAQLINLSFYHFVRNSNSKSISIYYHFSWLESRNESFDIHCLFREGLGFCHSRDNIQVNQGGPMSTIVVDVNTEDTNYGLVV